MHKLRVLSLIPNIPYTQYSIEPYEEEHCGFLGFYLNSNPHSKEEIKEINSLYCVNHVCNQIRR